MKILLVDDEIEFVSALAERLCLRGIEAQWVCRPEEAMGKIASGCFDVAVLDVKMPKIGGIALKGMLQKRCPDMKFIFLTGHGSEDAYRAGAAAAGADNYLLKPLRLKELLDKIHQITAEAK